MKKNFIKYIAALAVAPMLLSSCSDDFLNEIDPNRQTPTTFWTSEDNVMKGLSAVYNPFRRMTSGYYGGLEGIMHLQMRGDDLYPTRGEEPYIGEYLSFVNTTNTKDLSWGNIYEGIQMANEFIYRAATVDMDETKREQMIGEAYFLRGFWYFRLRTDYRDAVIRTLPQDADPETHGLSSGDEVLEQAISDFKEAKSRLPKLRSSDENGRVTQGAAIAMLGKAYIWKGDYQAAKDEFEIIMNGYGYDLTQKYEDNFRDDTEFNAESIWEINYDAKGNSGDAWGNGTSDDSFMGNNLAHYFGPTLKGENIGGGWYKMQPSPYLIKEFISEQRPEGSDSKWDKRLYTTCFFKYSDFGDVKPDEKFYGGKVEFDDMFKWTVLPEGDGKYGIAKQGYAPAYPVIEGVQGRFMMKKFAAWWVPTGCTMYSNDAGRINNLRIMRFAEVLLLHAEACLETNDESGAMKDINRIRVRAGLPEKNLSGKDAIMTELQKQKLLEFAGENIRWDDMVRWYGNDPAKLKAIMHERKTDSQHYELLYEENESGEKELVGYKPTDRISDTQGFDHFEAKFLYFPIPQAEVDANLNLEQKPEWR